MNTVKTLQVSSTAPPPLIKCLPFRSSNTKHSVIGGGAIVTFLFPSPPPVTEHLVFSKETFYEWRRCSASDLHSLHCMYWMRARIVSLGARGLALTVLLGLNETNSFK